MEKSPDAFRTISEVAESLETPAHVLRFWESRFPQIRPVKRAGGRRYYRPSDVALLSGIKRLLHDEGLTIRGVQKILREQGIRHVARLGNGGADVPDESEALEAQLSAALGVPEAEVLPPAEAETAQIIALETVLNRGQPAAPVQQDLWSQMPDPAPQDEAGAEAEDAPEAPMVELAESEESAVVTMTFSGGSAQPEATPPEDETPVSGDAYAEAVPQDAELSDPATESADDVPVSDGDEAGFATLAARLRALPPGALSHRADEVGALQDRILTLRAKLAETSRRRRR